jgi:UDP-N-acetylglucosamine--N-acetylmuramyl-(pentapeptide) pyrophosphoryl-undecaprenol N-acetylglucosamine transferase
MTVARKIDVLIAGGGTGGHVFPALALGTALAARGRTVGFAGTADGLEARVVPPAGFDFHALPGRQARGGGALRVVASLAATARGVLAAGGLLRAARPNLVVGVGGYASVATVLAARVARVPVVLLEQNTVPGAANRLLGRVASRVCLGFAEAAPFFPAGRSVHTGNPVRPDVLAGRAGARRDRPAGGAPEPDGLGLLVFGGSQGAHRLNEALLHALGALDARGTSTLGQGLASPPLLAITHQTGAADLEVVKAGYDRLGRPARVIAFVDDMGAAYDAADLVVARAGAMSCAEITARGLPAILMPYPFAADDHQRHNAEVLARAGAALVVRDDAGAPAKLAEVLRLLLGDPEQRARMASASRALGRPEAARHAADVCDQVMRGVLA